MRLHHEMALGHVDLWTDGSGFDCSPERGCWHTVPDEVGEAMLQPTDTLYADFTPESHLLPASSPWRYRLGDLVRLPSGEVVQILDGFLHVRRAVGSVEPASTVDAGSTVLIIRAVGEGSSL